MNEMILNMRLMYNKIAVDEILYFKKEIFDLPCIVVASFLAFLFHFFFTNVI